MDRNIKEPINCKDNLDESEEKREGEKTRIEKRTSDFYRTCNLPVRFNRPGMFKGYGIERTGSGNIRYRTTSGEYGRYPPNIHTVPTNYRPTVAQFSQLIGTCGMYRDYGLNFGIETRINKNL